MASATASFFGFMGAATACCLSCLGAAYGTGKASIGISASSVLRPEQAMRNVIPTIMAGVLGIYGLIMAIIIANGVENKATYTTYRAFAHLAAGLSVGVASLAAGMAIGVTGDAGVRASAQQPKLYVSMILMLIFGEALALFGLIVGLILQAKK